MRVAILSCFWPFRGGIAQFNANLVRNLSADPSTEVCAFNFTVQYPGFLFPGKTQLVGPDDECDYIVPSEAVLNSANPLSYEMAARKILRWKPDVLIVRYWMSYFGPSLGYVCRRCRAKGVKVIGIIDNAIPHEQRFFDGPFSKYFFSGLSGAIALCSAVEKDIHAIAPKVKTAVIPHPISTHFGDPVSREQACKELGVSPEGRNLLFFGLIREYKGLDILLEAFKLLEDESYHLIIAGEPYGSFEKYRAIIDSMPSEMKSRISTRLEFIPDKQTKGYFCAADLTVLPYRSATQSGVSAVCYHFGVPMVSTDVGGLREDILERGTGLLAAEITPEAVAAEIEKFFSDPSIAASCKKSIEDERERLSWPRFCQSLRLFENNL